MKTCDPTSNCDTENHTENPKQRWKPRLEKKLTFFSKSFSVIFVSLNNKQEISVRILMWFSSAFFQYYLGTVTILKPYLGSASSAKHYQLENIFDLVS